MTHIKERYGEPTNELILSYANYCILRDFLKAMSVQLRVISHDGETDTVLVQAQNLPFEAMKFRGTVGSYTSLIHSLTWKN